LNCGDSKMHKDLDGHPDELVTKVVRAYRKSKRRE
jgi:hypothetical protein